MRAAVLFGACSIAAIGLRLLTRPAARAPRPTAAEIRRTASGPPRILVSKSARRLALFLGDREAFSTRCAIGSSPAGHKEREGDRRTPEGDYYVCTRNEKSRFHLFLGLSYPNVRDAERALKAGRITRAEFDAISDRICAKSRPPWDTPLGGEVGIHGKGASRDWTAGCVALEDADIELLWEFCPLGTPVRIEP